MLFQDPQIQSIAEQDPKSMLRMLPEIPLWVKNPDFDRVRQLCISFFDSLIDFDFCY